MVETNSVEQLLSMLLADKPDCTEDDKCSARKSIARMVSCHSYCMGYLSSKTHTLMLLGAQCYDAGSTEVALHCGHQTPTLTYMTSHIVANIPDRLVPAWKPHDEQWWYEMRQHGLVSVNREPLDKVSWAHKYSRTMCNDYVTDVHTQLTLSMARKCDCVLAIGSAHPHIVKRLPEHCNCLVSCNQPVFDRHSWSMPMEAILCLIKCLESYSRSQQAKSRPPAPSTTWRVTRG